MSTTVVTSADVKSANITEADIIAWLRSRAAESGIPGLILSADSEDDVRYPWVAKIKNDHDAFGCGTTIEAALTMLKPSIKTPEKKADEMRAKAAKLLADADALAPQLTPTAVIQDREGAGV